MRFGGLVAVKRSLVLRRAWRHHRADRPEWRSKTTVFNCITGFYKPTVGRIALRQGSIPSRDMWRR